MATVTQHHEIPLRTQARAALDFDYVDRFTVTTEGCSPATPEQWARTVVEDTAGLGGQLIWRGALQLRLSSGPDRVGGWAIGDGGPDWLRLEAASWALTAHLVIEVGDDELSVATLLRYDNPAGRLLWTPLSAVHRHLMPGLLRGGVHVSRSGGA